MIWLIVLVLIGLALVYFLVIRPVLVESVLLSPAFKAEASLFDQLRVKVAGWKTKMASRSVVIAGLMVAGYDQLLPLVSGQDWTPITAKLPSWALPVGMVLIGWLFSYLRHVTENPPEIITQRTDDGGVHVVALNK